MKGGNCQKLENRVLVIKDYPEIEALPETKRTIDEAKMGDGNNDIKL